MILRELIWLRIFGHDFAFCLRSLFDRDRSHFSGMSLGKEKTNFFGIYTF